MSSPISNNQPGFSTLPRLSPTTHPPKKNTPNSSQRFEQFDLKPRKESRFRYDHLSHNQELKPLHLGNLISSKQTMYEMYNCPTPPVRWPGFRTWHVPVHLCDGTFHPWLSALVPLPSAANWIQQSSLPSSSTETFSKFKQLSPSFRHTFSLKTHMKYRRLVTCLQQESILYFWILLSVSSCIPLAPRGPHCFCFGGPIEASAPSAANGQLNGTSTAKQCENRRKITKSNMFHAF